MSYLDKALDLHFKNPFKKWSSKKYIYKQKTFVKILQRITIKKSQLDKKQVIISFENRGNPQASIIRGHCRGPVQEVKNKLQKWCEVVDVDEFCTSKLYYHCHFEMAKVKYNGKEINSALHCSSNDCGITIDCDINGAMNIFMLLEKMIQKER
jgi:hypothetical protein